MKCVCLFVFPRRQSAGMQPNSIQGRIFPWDLSDVKFDLLKVTGQSCDITPKYFLTSIFSFYSRKLLSFSIFILIQNQKLGVFFPSLVVCTDVSMFCGKTGNYAFWQPVNQKTVSLFYGDLASTHIKLFVRCWWKHNIQCNEKVFGPSGFFFLFLWTSLIK